MKKCDRNAVDKAIEIESRDVPPISKLAMWSLEILPYR